MTDHKHPEVPRPRFSPERGAVQLRFRRCAGRLRDSGLHAKAQFAFGISYRFAKVD